MRLFEDKLTPRQEEVLAVLAEGKKNKEIAKQLHLSCNTVHNHVQAIFEALDVNCRAAAVNCYNQRLRERMFGEK
jgi:DNA-binding NarL/FixJ family response regulator